MPECVECGAELPRSAECWTRVHELLEVENRVLAGIDGETAKRAHYFAIASYQLQHPSRLTRAAAEGLRSGVREMLGPGAPSIDAFRRAVGRRVSGTKVGRVAEAGDRHHVHSNWPRRWTVTAVDVLAQPDDAYPQAATEWASACLRDLDAALTDPSTASS
ncbi:hypothetical protein EHW97_11600 [Aeromicrobium camelliae]|uniref:Uncharacterized protein n=1 Tax=Aeromicrobium camelliae TaxID=1538144 RepID=A0A3N6W6C9_9ACTN|nr:DUF5946 family protein [Aeromicrobium camelliae]RQN03070.1 hypothetical protein EHW97_11600 [Aeromicrobium camelliae]